MATHVLQAILALQAFAWGRPFLVATVQTSRSAILPAEIMQNAQLRMYVHANKAGVVLIAASRLAILPAEIMQNAQLRMYVHANRAGLVSHAK